MWQNGEMNNYHNLVSNGKLNESDPSGERSFPAPVGEATLAGLHKLQPVQTQEIIKL